MLESTENIGDIRVIHSDEGTVSSNEILRRWITDDAVFDLLEPRVERIQHNRTTSFLENNCTLIRVAFYPGWNIAMISFEYRWENTQKDIPFRWL